MSASLKRGCCKLFYYFRIQEHVGRGSRWRNIFTLSVQIFSISGCVESLNDCGGTKGGADLEFVGRVYAEVGEPAWVIWGSNFVQTFRPNFVTLHFTGYEPGFNLIVGSELGRCGSFEGIVESPRNGSKDQFASTLKPSLAFVKAELNFYEYIRQTLKNSHKKGCTLK